MGSSGGTTVQKADPWSGQQPYLKEVFSEAQSLYKSGQLAPDYYSGQTVAPQSDWTKQALQMQAERATQGSASIGNAQQAMDAISSGQTQGANSGLEFLKDFTKKDSLNQNAGYAALGDVSAQALSGNTALAALQGLASQDVNAGNAGLAALQQMTSAVNPYSSALYADAAGQAAAKIDSGFSAAGRYGSGAHENARSDALGDIYSQMFSKAYDSQLAAAQSASQQYSAGVAQNAANAQTAAQLYDAALDTRLSAAQDMAALQQQDWAQKLSAAQNAGALQNSGVAQQISAAQVAQQLANQRYADAAALSEAGAAQDAYAQQLTNADIERWNHAQQAPLEALFNYNQLIQGNYGSTKTTTGQQSTASSVLGGAASGAALGTSLMPGIGTAVGAGIGGLLGLL